MELQSVADYGAEIICAGETRFPAMLKWLSPPPPLLTFKGNWQLAQGKCVALVGSRQASAAGRKLARQMTADLSAMGYVCVSGLARGIDGEVHAASLDGGTIAVIAGGIDHIYPQQHGHLYQAIAEQGLILSENPIGYRGHARDFPRRNRLITGLCAGVVIVEAAERSGSLISARTAAEQGREVMAVPGSPLDLRAAGTNRLIREGATLVRTAQDVDEALSRLTGKELDMPEPPQYVTDPLSAPISPEQRRTVQAVLSHTPVTLDDIARTTHLSAARCAAILVELELEGKALTLPGGLACLNTA